MNSLQRMNRLGQIKGVAYEPTPSDVIMGNVGPNCHDPNNCRDFDMDYFNSDFAELWGPSGRDDLGNIRSQSINLLRLYNWTGNEGGGTPLRDHRPYLDYCQKIGLGTMVPFSNYNVTISGTNALNTANSIVGELTDAGKIHPAAKMWQVTNEFELGNIKPEDVARLVQYIVQAEESAGVNADDNKIPIVVGVSTAVKYGVAEQSMGQIEALRMAFGSGGTLPDGTAVQGNAFLNQRNVFAERFVIGVQSFQVHDEIAKFTQNVLDKYQTAVPILLTEHGFNSVEAAVPVYGGNGQSHDDANQARLVATQIDNINQLCKKYSIMRGMCFFQWLNTTYKCGVMGAGNQPVYQNACTEGNFGEVEWSAFGAGQAQPDKFGKTTKDQPFPIDAAAKKSAVYDAVSKGFAAS